MKSYYEFKKFGLVFFLGLLLFSIAGCGASSYGFNAPTPPALSAANLNLIFVISPDLANDPLGDLNADTANLNNQGLQRSLLLSTYLKQQLLGANNVNGIHTLEPMTHLQTAGQYPDMAALWFMQQFAMLNQTTVEGTTANSFPLGASYGSPEDVPAGVAMPLVFSPDCQGLVFDDASHNNVDLVRNIIQAGQPGFYVFSAPWETTSALLADLNTAMGYNLNLPAAYTGSNLVYVISVTPSGAAGLTAFDSQLHPGSTYPTLPAPVPLASDTLQHYFSYNRTGGINGVVVPQGTNTNETVYLVRHAEAHPSNNFEDGNYVAAGQWRALDLPNVLPGALRGQPAPTQVYSIDPAQAFLKDDTGISYVRPSLTVLPYAIANNLPYNLAASFFIGAPDSQSVARATYEFFFTNLAGHNFSHQVILLAWEHEHFPPLVTYILQQYGGTDPLPALTWPQTDYDTIWTLTLDAQGNLTVNNALCEGIDSANLPKTAPPF